MAVDEQLSRVLQRLFVQEYIIDFNGTQAAIRAGYSSKGASVRANDLLRNIKIKAEIVKAISERVKRTGVTADRVINELAALAFSDSTEAVTIEKGKAVFKDTQKLSKETRKAIAGIKEKKSKDGTSLQITFHNKPKALELLGKHLGILVEEVKHTGKISLEQLILGSMKKGKEGK